MDSIIGREPEKRILKQILHSSEPEFLAIYGRRRVGKTAKPFAFLLIPLNKTGASLPFRRRGVFIILKNC